MRTLRVKTPHWLAGLSAVALVGVGVACESSDATTANGSSGSGGVSSSSGGVVSAGGGGFSGSAGAVGGGGAPGGAGQSGGGDAATGGASGGNAGASGSAGNEGQGGAVTGPQPSAGCGKPKPASGESQITIQGKPGVYYINIPSAYDPANPYPLVFGFHGRNLNYKDCLNANCSGLKAAAGESAVLVYMSSIGKGWEGDGEREINVEFFRTMLANVEKDYCIDQRRVFVTGSSSGAQFTNILACRFGDLLRGAAPVAGATLEKNGCKGNVAAMVIHGVDDYHVTFAAGQDTRDTYLRRSSCGMDTDKPLAMLHDSVVKNRESHQCTAYSGCKAPYPVTWCEHSEGGYDGSTHGWPLFAGAAVWDFFKVLGPDGG